MHYMRFAMDTRNMEVEMHYFLSWWTQSSICTISHSLRFMVYGFSRILVPISLDHSHKQRLDKEKLL